MTLLRTANLLATLSGAVQSRIDGEIKRHPNQTDSSLAALNVIGTWEGCNNTALSKAIGLSHPATVRLVDKLEADGLVRSERGRDRRSLELYLTERGRRVMVDLLKKRCVAVADLIDLLDEEERSALTGILEHILSGLAKTSNSKGDLCRLCNEIFCPWDICPAHQHHMGPAAS